MLSPQGAQRTRVIGLGGAGKLVAGEAVKQSNELAANHLRLVGGVERAVLRQLRPDGLDSPLDHGVDLLTGGRLGDRFGRRRVFLAGLVGFALASLACGVAPTATALVISRLAQGAAAAVLLPQVLSILSVTYTGAARVRAFTWYGIVLGSAWVGGQVVGGVFIQTDLFGWGWRTCFLINVPISVIALLLTRRAVGESRSQTFRSLDGPGVALVTVGLGLLVGPLVLGRQYGWPAWSIACLVLSAPVLAFFLGYQSRLGRRGGSPLIETALLKSRPFRAGTGLAFANFAGMTSFFLVFSVYLQEGEGLSALGGAIAFLPVGIGFLVTSFSAPLLSRVLGHRSIAVGALVVAVGDVALALVVGTQDDHLNAWTLVGPLLLSGAGLGAILTPLTARVLSGVAPDHAGAASGLVSTMQQVGGSVGVALIGIIFYGVIGTGGARGVTYAPAFQFSLIYTVALAGAVAVLAMRLPRPRR